MRFADLPSRREVAAIENWAGLKQAYRGVGFVSNPFEPVEAYGVRKHSLDQRLPKLQEFWRYHVAPATNRPEDTHLCDKISQATSRMAERSYEIYCNICDALDELDAIAPRDGIDKSASAINERMKPPRYRPCLNILLFCGDALLLFDALVDIIGVRHRHVALAENTLSALIRPKQKIVLLPDRSNAERWEERRERLIAYRHMLVHHGRPWLHFKGEEFSTPPFVLRGKHCRHEDKDRYQTWSKQIAMFKDPKHEDKFIRLDEACRLTCEDTIRFLDDGYGRIVETLDDVLADPKIFLAYRDQWGIANSLAASERRATSRQARPSPSGRSWSAEST